MEAVEIYKKWANAWSKGDIPTMQNEALVLLDIFNKTYQKKLSNDNFETLLNRYRDRQKFPESDEYLMEWLNTDFGDHLDSEIEKWISPEFKQGKGKAKARKASLFLKTFLRKIQENYPDL